jgi:hypothetical protein
VVSEVRSRVRVPSEAEGPATGSTPIGSRCCTGTAVCSCAAGRPPAPVP